MSSTRNCVFQSYVPSSRASWGYVVLAPGFGTNGNMTFGPVKCCGPGPTSTPFTSASICTRPASFTSGRIVTIAVCFSLCDRKNIAPSPDRPSAGR